MNRLLAGAAAIVAGTLVSAAAAVDLPPPVTTPTVTVPSVPTPTLPTPTLPTPTLPSPTLPAPTVPAPTVPAPTVPAPTLPAPTVPAPTVPAPTPPAPTAPATTAPASTVPARGGSGASPAPKRSTPATSAAPPPAATVTAGSGHPEGTYAPQREVPAGSSGRGRAARQPHRPRPRLTRFHLRRPGAVRVVAWQLAPRCRLVGRYSVRADRGANVLRVPKRIGKHRLRPGTYRFVGASRGTRVLDVRVRLVRKKQLLRVRRNHLVDVCPAAVTVAATSLPPSGGGFAAAVPQPPAPAPHPGRSAPGAPPTRESSPRLPPVLRDLEPATASPLVRAIFFALLGGAIALLAAAALPDGAVAAATGGFVTRHRAVVTLGGFTLLVVAAVVTLLA